MLIVSVVTAVYIFLFKNNYNDVPTIIIIMLEEELLLEEWCIKLHASWHATGLQWYYRYLAFHAGDYDVIQHI